MEKGKHFNDANDIVLANLHLQKSAYCDDGLFDKQLKSNDVNRTSVKRGKNMFKKKDEREKAEGGWKKARVVVYSLCK